jgi:hypothetical protein
MATLVYCNDNQLLKNNYYFALSTTPTCNPTQLPSFHTGIANSGTILFYFAPGAPVTNLNPRAPAVGVRRANGLPEQSIASATHASAPSLPPAAMQGHVMPSFPHTLIGLGPFANLGCQICPPRRRCPSFIQMGISSSKVGEKSTAPTCGASRSKPPSQVCSQQRCLTNMTNWAHAEALPIFHRRLPSSQFSVHQRPPCHPHASLLPQIPPPCSIPARGSAPLTMLDKPASSATSMERPKPWLLLPGPPQPLSIPAAVIFPVLVLLLDSNIHALGSLSNRHGWKPSKLVTATLFQWSNLLQRCKILPGCG